MARILFTTQPASGHLRPLVPIARAARDRGHEIAVVAPEVMGRELAGYGLPHVVGGYDWRFEAFGMIPDDWRTMTFEASTDAFRSLGGPLTELFAGRYALESARDFLEVADNYEPDLIVRELDEMGGYLAAEVLAIPHISIASFGGLDAVTGPALAPHLNEGRVALGLPEDPTGNSLYRYLHANFLPPQYSEKEMILPNTRCYRHPNAETRYGKVDSWFAELRHDKPFVFVGFGTVVYDLPGSFAFVETIIAALGELDAEVVLAVGSGRDTSMYGVVPTNVHLVDFVEQPLVLEGADLFVTHGGLNSMKEAMRLGVPMVCVPILDDHRHNARECEASGTTRTVSLAEFDSHTIVSACREVLSSSSFRTAARIMQRHVHAMPSLDSFIDDAERLVADNLAGAIV